MSDGTPTPASRRPDDAEPDGIADDTPEQELAEDFSADPDSDLDGPDTGTSTDAAARDARDRDAVDGDPVPYDAVPASEHAARGEAGTELTDAPPALEEPPVLEREERDFSTAGSYTEPEPVADAPGAEDRPASEPVAPVAVPLAATAVAPTVATDPNASRVVYVQPPVPPRKRGNRVFGALIALVSTVLFAALYAGIAVLLLALRGPADGVERGLVGFVSSTAFIVPVVYYAVFAIVIALLINRGGWWAHVIGSLVVGILVYVFSVGTILLLANVVGMSPSEARLALAGTLGQPILFAAAVAAREVALWIGLGIAARGRRVTARNAEAREAFDREQADAERERAHAAF
jgi:hypothetical protein